MKPKKLLYVIAFIQLIVSCGKDGPGGTPKTTVSGYVYEKDTQKPLEDIPVKLVDMGGGALGMAGGGSANSSQAVFVTGPDGYYHFDFEGDGSYGIFSDGRWPEYSHLPGYKPVNKGEHNEISFTLQPQAWLRLHIKNVNPHNHLDRISLMPGNSPVTFTGEAVDVFEIYKVWGNTNRALKWAVEKNDLVTNYSDTIYLLGNDTTFYEILY
tara:strand:- start:260738 stop:261370 length:633 start_codon:yes stop_codon:yes gene_type:complete